ncbi:MAG: bifunctional riboflavin kinase/FAD synthetase [Verrucomicrobia bacterium]|nr:bifunctional riboflavin kinase/FAD synthetase [Verrucomicrobiota bacterium]
MRLHSSIAELATVPGPVCLAIGVFDGVHLGHQAVIRRALEDARAADGTAVVVTFDPHPMRVMRPQQAPRLLTSTRHKAQLIEQLGAGELLVLPFTPGLSATPPEEFVLALHAACRPLREICVGHTWSFGHNRTGNLELLKTMGDQLGFDEIGLPAVEIDGEVVSSTAIRAAVEEGDLARAARLLGRDFAILGTVVHGDHLGRTIGFPTANLSAHNEQFPPNGVYAVEALQGGRKLPGVVNIGVRPTIATASGERVLELHLFDFTSDIYGQDVEVVFRRFLRPEQKFSGLDALKTQIARDVSDARKALGI